jgi:Acyl-CoA dehydrogenase, C-terminal domain
LQRSIEKILTTHTGSLPRPSALLDLLKAKDDGQPVDVAQFENVTADATKEVAFSRSPRLPLPLRGAEQIRENRQSHWSVGTNLQRRNPRDARLMMLQALENALAAAAAGRQSDLDLRLRNRLNQSFSVRLIVQAIDALFQAAGGQGIFTAKPIQRAWRDIHAGALHVSLTWDAVSTMYGQYALGLDPKGQF